MKTPHPALAALPPELPVPGAAPRPRVVLGIETAGETCAVALAEVYGPDGASRVVAEATLRRANQHGTRLAPLVAMVLEMGGARADDVAAVAVSAGPGSYTGLRIGASLAKGFCEATGAALVAVPSLDALAEAARPAVLAGERLLAAFPSRRGEVYAALYLRNESDLGSRPDLDLAAAHAAALLATVPGPAHLLRGAAADADEPFDPEMAALLFDAVPGYNLLRRATPLTIDDAAEWADEGRGPLVLAGEGAPRLVAALGPDALLPETVAGPSAAVVARMGARRWAAGLVEDVATWAPLYLKAWGGG